MSDHTKHSIDTFSVVRLLRCFGSAETGLTTLRPRKIAGTSGETRMSVSRETLEAYAKIRATFCESKITGSSAPSPRELPSNARLRELSLCSPHSLRFRSAQPPPSMREACWRERFFLANNPLPRSKPAFLPPLPRRADGWIRGVFA